MTDLKTLTAVDRSRDARHCIVTDGFSDLGYKTTNPPQMGGTGSSTVTGNAQNNSGLLVIKDHHREGKVRASSFRRISNAVV